MQSMTSATTIDSTSTSTSTKSTPSSPSRHPALRCQTSFSNSAPHYHPSTRPSSPSSSSTSSPIDKKSRPSSLRPLNFPHLIFFTLDSILCTSTEISTFIHSHGGHLSEFKFEATTLTSGDWDDALAPLTALAGGCDAWKREARREEEVPICLGPELSPVEVRSDSSLLFGERMKVPVAVREAREKEKGGMKGGWMGRSPLLGLKRGMGRPCAVEVAMEMQMQMRGGMDTGIQKMGAKGMGGGQRALEDGVRKLLAQTVFPWF